MKKKYINMKHFLYYDQECIDYLQDLSKKGWQLESLGIFLAKFIPCDHLLKYQIDCTPMSEEYLNIIKEQGYQWIDSCNDIHIFVNKNINALDLQTDQDVYQQILLSQFQKSNMIGVFVFGILMMALGFLNIYQYFIGEKALYYIHYASVMTGVYFLFLGLLLMDSDREIYIKRKAIMNMTYSKSSLKKLDVFHSIKSIIVVILTLLFLFRIYLSDSSLSSFVIIWIGLFFMNLLQSFFKMRVHSHTKQVTITIGISIIMFISMLSFMNLGITMPKQFPDYQTHYCAIENKYVKYYQTIAPDADVLIFQNFYHCQNEDIAQILFEYEITEEEKLTRYPTDEEISQYLNQNHKNSWSVDDIEKVSYKDALKVFQRYSSMAFEECYYLNHIVIAKHQNKVVKVFVEDINHIDETLKPYLEF